MKKAKKKQKTANYEPGYEVLLQLDEMLRVEARPPPAKDVKEALKEFVDYKWHARWLEDVQLEKIKQAYVYIRQEMQKGGLKEGLSDEDLGTTIGVLMKRPYGRGKSQTALNLAVLLFEDARARYEAKVTETNSSTERDWHREQFQGVVASYTSILATNGMALEAQDFAEQCLKDDVLPAETVRWPVAKGLIKECLDAELEVFVKTHEARGWPFKKVELQKIISEYARERKDLEKARQWYCKPLPDGRKHMAKTLVGLLALCIEKDGFEFGEELARLIVKENPKDKGALDMTLRWAANQGKGVEEVERMIELMRQQNESRPEMQPDMKTINRLATHAIRKFNDYYTAERYIALGQKLGFQPDADTHLLQLSYRIKNKDLTGAMSAYSALRHAVSELSNEQLLSLNKLIVALCEQRSQDYDAIMSLVDDLSQLKAPFLPDTVAALAKLHLRRHEMDDLEDLLNTYAPSFGTGDRELVCVGMVDHVLSPTTQQIPAWESWNLTRKLFPEVPVPVRVEVMKSFFNRNRPDMATVVFGQMRHSHMKEQRPKIDTYAECLQGIAEHSDRESLSNVHNMFKLDMEVEPNTKLYNALMLAYVGCDDSSRALEFWEDIIHSKEGPTYASIQIALQACERVSFGAKKAAKIWKRLLASDIEMSEEIYSSYVGALAGQGMFDECVRMCNNAEKEGFSVDALL